MKITDELYQGSWGFVCGNLLTLVLSFITFIYFLAEESIAKHYGYMYFLSIVDWFLPYIVLSPVSPYFFAPTETFKKIHKFFRHKSKSICSEIRGDKKPQLMVLIDSSSSAPKLVPHQDEISYRESQLPLQEEANLGKKDENSEKNGTEFSTKENNGAEVHFPTMNVVVEKPQGETGKEESV